MMACIGCEWRLALGDSGREDFAIERYDRIESLYLTTGDYSALQQMNTNYPQQTRTLIEDVLKIGQVNDPEINTKFLSFFQDSTLQLLVAEAEAQYADMSDVNAELNSAFEKLEELLPGITWPVVYTQIGSLDQSIIAGDGMLGISLDKYLGEDYWLYKRPEYGYSKEQRQQMTRKYIVPDCMGFYLISLYPPASDRELSQLERDLHIGKIQWVVNRVMGRDVFRNPFVERVDAYMKRNKSVSVDLLLNMKDIEKL